MDASSSPSLSAAPAPAQPVRGTLRFPTMVHFIMASVVLTPLALLPYLPIRARLVRLSRQVQGCNKAIAALRQDVTSVSHAEDMVGLKAEVEALRRSNAAAREQLASATRDLTAMREAIAASIAQQNAIAHSVNEELAQLRARADLPPDVLGGLGDGFAAMANFVEETEIIFGLNTRAGLDLDRRGISTMRQTALRLKALRETGPAYGTDSSWPGRTAE
ncbi:hypothetical protein EXIGLDRAFT_758354 [Exidia glandulosa HHB12029]|uniref:Uncharacterized protein n=1 Tax=Exidia glandulosa HHB12029 TaxID=1314781 RepID=A0A165QTJ2_EXIGL|nr:hypothetical protein EXIGLDRAFT_758354 [Exidia glandulosa HHB12029]